MGLRIIRWLDKTVRTSLGEEVFAALAAVGNFWLGKLSIESNKGFIK